MGHKVEQFVKDIDENLICPICKTVFEDPVICKDGHSFCKECIDQRLKESKKCPVDGRMIDNQTFSRNFVLCGILGKLDVFCQRPDESKDEKDVQQTCEWNGKLHSLAKHRETCPFQQVQCPNVNCNSKLQRRELANHEKVCWFKKVLCEECQLGMVLHQVEKHKADDCPETLILCPNECTDTQGMTVKIKRSKSQIHLTNNCKRTAIHCPFKDQGCSDKVERQHVEKHVQDNMAPHMMLLARQCSLLTKENQVLYDELKITKRKINDLEIEVINKSRYVWTILDFPTQVEKYTEGIWIRSPTFWLCGNCWFLKLYPNGRDKKSKEYVSLCLVLSDEDILVRTGKPFVVATNEVSVAYARITVKSQSQAASITHDVTLNPRFESTGVVSEVAMISKLMKTNEALSPDFCSVTDGCITVSCILS
ncbi:TNF receptor-associated factor family protein DDB_G0277243-like [Actinia tenebrosa]|uniref:TNF receptor-associated factor family protein DDB_G0277243-like n=1 Tax=Actinia tenebrosa TaxID=6105 RepID=A0A6P8HEL6_ACTTE|nr:TNF receptor-associated factor family protein DDB_G0277243-like [Actinia tenebrosa]